MKKLIVLILCFVLTSCTFYGPDEESVKYTTSVVLDKREQGISRAGTIMYSIYLYDGYSANWLTTDFLTYSQFKKGDSIKSLLIKTTYYTNK